MQSTRSKQPGVRFFVEDEDEFGLENLLQVSCCSMAAGLFPIQEGTTNKYQTCKANVKKYFPVLELKQPESCIRHDAHLALLYGAGSLHAICGQYVGSSQSK